MAKAIQRVLELFGVHSIRRTIALEAIELASKGHRAQAQDLIAHFPDDQRAEMAKII